MLLWLMAWLLSSAFSPALSQAQGLRFATDANAPLTARADKVIWQQAKGRADLSGKAHITQGPLSMKADAMHLLMGASGEAQTLVSQGHVVVLSNMGSTSQDGVRRADADTAHYDLKANTLLLSGNVHVSQSGDLQGGKVSGQSLKIDMQSGLARILGTGSQNNAEPGRARIEFE